MKDPDKRVAGQGAKALRDAGITVIGPVIPELCRRVNKGFVSLRENGRPYITLKRAQTRDGAIAKPDGSKLCITSDTQNLWSHTFLRATHDAILVGVQTVITDDPQLSIRIGNSECGIVNQPWKIILDPELRIPLEARVIDEKCIVITNEVHNAKGSREEKEETLKEKGAIVFSMPMENNQCNLHDLFSLNSKFLIQNSISTFLVEGGSKTWNAFTEAGMIDEEVILIG